MVATTSFPVSSLPLTPSIDAGEAREAAEEIAYMIRRLGPDSLVGTVLKQAVRELRSLEQSAAGTALGPYRVAA
ncbi:MAG TPA: hypothetical protein VGJ05_06900 [Fimbriiglobus sp.]|jgi:hypothetical protein